MNLILADLAQSVWNDLESAPGNAKSPFLLGVLGTKGESSVALRTVVVRQVSARQRMIVCHTDVRAHKVRQIDADDRIQWLFYDSVRRLQIILSGRGRVHQSDEIARTQWEQTPVTGRVHYCVTAPPGTEIPAAGTGLPTHWEGKLPEATAVEFGYVQFAVVVSVVETFEWLQIGAEGPIKAQFTWRENHWQGRWLIP